MDVAVPDPPRSETVDRYLETIYYIEHEGEVARPGRLAEWLGVRPPTVSVSLQRLQRGGWVTVAADRSVQLTLAGEKAATEIVRRHRLLERWLCDVLGLDWSTADREAGALAHGISDLVLERLDRHLGRPVTCPHGNHIPGRPMPTRHLVGIAGLAPGTDATVARISEVAEHDAPQLLGRLHQSGLIPGAAVRVQGRQAGELDLLVEGTRISLPMAVAAVLWVEVVDP